MHFDILTLKEVCTYELLNLLVVSCIAFLPAFFFRRYASRYGIYLSIVFQAGALVYMHHAELEKGVFTFLLLLLLAVYAVSRIAANALLAKKRGPSDVEHPYNFLASLIRFVCGSVLMTAVMLPMDYRFFTGGYTGKNPKNISVTLLIALIGLVVCIVLTWLITFRRLADKHENGAPIPAGGIYRLSRYPELLVECFVLMFLAVSAGYILLKSNLALLIVIFLVDVIFFATLFRRAAMMEQDDAECYGKDDAYIMAVRRAPIFFPLIPIKTFLKK